jgi:hypothetical protein
MRLAFPLFCRDTCGRAGAERATLKPNENLIVGAALGLVANRAEPERIRNRLVGGGGDGDADHGERHSW